MQFFGRITINRMSNFLGRVTPKVNNFFVMSDLRYPWVFLQFWTVAYAFQSIHIVVLAICAILPTCCFSQIFKSVIRPATVYVINKLFRPFTCFVEPNKPMGAIMFPMEFNVNIPFMVECATHITDFNARTGNLPKKIACLRIVSEDFKKMLMCYHGRILPRLG